jgi:hypothetical protein
VATVGESGTSLGAILKRRWYAVVAGLLITAGLVGAAYQLVPPGYEVTAHVLLLPPAASVPAGGNPYLGLGGLDPAVAILSRAMSDSGTVLALRAEGASGEYTVLADQLTSGPVLLVTEDAKTAAGAVTTLDLILARLPVTLSELQTSVGTTPTWLITETVITQDVRATLDRKSQTRALIVALAAGLVLTLLLASGLDALLRLRARRRSRSPRSSKKSRETVDAADTPAPAAAEALVHPHEPGVDLSLRAVGSRSES